MPTLPYPLILASRSPRRRELLAEAGYEFQVLAAREPAECGRCSRESPPEFVARLAWQKAVDVASRLPELERGPGTARQLADAAPRLILACDTVAEWGGQIIGKPIDEQHAGEILRTLSGREHHVYSGLCLWRYPGGWPRVEVAVSTLRMEPLSEAQLAEYLASGLWEGKAGAFGYQDRLGWLHLVAGSESNVVGLPLELLARMMDELLAVDTAAAQQQAQQ
ncbi:MAG: septum formation protein Maf [Planctomycetaceae bacterium]|nr:septum formation protein Maf [Planctomycetaceae bacterium]